MRILRCALLPLLLLSACATEVTHGEAARTPAAAADPVATDDDAESVPPEAEAYAVPQLALDAPTTAHARFVVNGFLDSDAHAIFRLRTDLGCPNDATLAATRSGVAFAIPLDVAQLTEVFACAVHVDAQSESELPPITVTPDTETVSAPADLHIDPGLVALVAVDLEAHSGHRVRFEVVADGPLDGANVTLGGLTYGAIIAPNDDTQEPRTAIFEVPARAWASAIIDGSDATVDVTHAGGAHGTLVLRPVARVEAESPASDAGCAH